ncbi:MAG: hypothetical protein HYT12_02945 [Candidatus Liptonbacteria bacterium]|nr:hypothetical protein [Candidatus Liptonbacteria bacterium]
MRTRKFESEGLVPLGQGGEKRVFVDPKNEGRIIAEMRPGLNETLRQMKGRFYLTKIAHLLFPDNIPDIHQVTESADKIQTADTDRIAHTEGQSVLQEGVEFSNASDRREQKKGDEYWDRGYRMLNKELKEGARDLEKRLEGFGLGDCIDSFVANFSRGKDGNVYYLETFRPWTVYSDEVAFLGFEEEKLKSAIQSMADERGRRTANEYLERLLVLFKEEKKEKAKK